MATLTELRPNDDIYVVNLQKVDDGGSTFWEALDDDPDSPNSTDFVRATYDLYGTWGLTSVDADFGNMDTAVIAAYISTEGSRSDDDWYLYVKVTDSTGAVDYIEEVLIATWDGGGADTGLLTAGSITTAGEEASEADWNAARLGIRWDIDQAKNNDGNRIVVDAIEMRGTYTAAAANVEATPPVKTLTSATFAPTIALGPLSVTPAQVDLTVATFIPTVAIQENVSIEVPVKTLTEATFAPTFALGPLDVTPSQKDLTAATFAPTVALGPLEITPSIATVTYSTFAPDVGISQVVIPPVKTLTTATFAPTFALGPLSIAVPVTSPSLTTYIPGVVIGGNVDVEVPVASLTQATFAPTAANPFAVTVPAVGTTYTTYVPTVDATTGGPVAVEVPVVGMSILTYIPTVTIPAEIKDGGDDLVERPRQYEKPPILDPVERPNPLYEMRMRQNADIEANRAIQEEVSMVNATVKAAGESFEKQAKENFAEKLPMRRRGVEMNTRQQFARDREAARQKGINDARLANLTKARKAKKRKARKKK